TAMAELLLSHGADPNLVGQDKKTPLSIASEAGDVDLMQVLIDAGADARQPELIRTALRSRDLPSFHLLLNSGADPETSMGKGKKLLDEAITCGSLSMTRLLLESGADPKGHLWAALGAGDETLGEMLLFYGASASEKGPDGRLPIDFALETDSKTLMEALLEDGAIPNGKGSDGEYWVARAIREGNASAAETLIDHGACLDGIAAADGHSLLGWAIAHGMQGVIQRLIDQGADVRAREPSPASDAFTAAFTRSKTFRWHLQSDSKINPLMLAAAQGDTKTAKLLIDAGAQKGDYSKRYLWPVNIAAWHGDVAMMQIIFGRDPDPDRQPRRVIIDLSSQKATLYEDGRVAYSTRVSTGKSGYRTPSGVYVITDKHRHHTSSLYDASMPYFMRLSCAAFGLHQGYVPGYPASHGCIRVPESGARHLFGVCEVGDVVEIRQ
ncbi:MAG: ankyrin repeat domain-containing protein, partial [Verrucomicrobiae bacterium]|nr:ankyrin repeat domain-containing protein [Verrucomicrobiae bacterium]